MTPWGVGHRISNCRAEPRRARVQKREGGGSRGGLDLLPGGVLRDRLKGRLQGGMPVERGEEEEDKEDGDGENEVAGEEEKAVMVVVKEEEESESAH